MDARFEVQQLLVEMRILFFDIPYVFENILH
jgi:hypothetical protein